MDDRQMLVEVLKDIEEMDHKLDEIRRAATHCDPPHDDFMLFHRELVDASARFLVEVKRKVAKYLAGQ